jgi:hypothetical protein
MAVPQGKRQKPSHAMIRRVYVTGAAAILFSGCVATSTRQTIPPPGRFGTLHPARARFQSLLVEQAPRAKVRRAIYELTLSGAVDTPHSFIGQRQFLALPPTLPPSRRAFSLLKHWPKGMYAQLPNDVRLLACFNDRDRLVAYELF